jgi:hypothetical protein
MVPRHRLGPPLFYGPALRVHRGVIQVVLALADGLGVAAQQAGDVRSPPVAELGGLDGRIPPAVLLRERVVEHPHRVLDLGAVCHEGSPWRGLDHLSHGYTIRTENREVIESAILNVPVLGSKIPRLQAITSRKSGKAVAWPTGSFRRALEGDDVRTGWSVERGRRFCSALWSASSRLANPPASSRWSVSFIEGGLDVLGKTIGSISSGILLSGSLGLGLRIRGGQRQRPGTRPRIGSVGPASAG